MSVSDDSAAGNNGKIPRKRPVYLSDAQWKRIRIHYETDQKVTHPDLAAEYGVSPHTVERRAMVEKWRKQDADAQTTANLIRQQTETALTVAADKTITKVAQQFADKLLPLIEREKTRYTRSMISHQRRHNKRLVNLSESGDLETAKDEAMFAKAWETHDNITRRTLGMNDGSPAGGSLNLNILTNQAAVQVVAQP